MECSDEKSEKAEGIDQNIYSITKHELPRIGIIFRRLRKFSQMEKEYQIMKEAANHDSSSKRKKLENPKYVPIPKDGINFFGDEVKPIAPTIEFTVKKHDVFIKEDIPQVEGLSEFAKEKHKESSDQIAIFEKEFQTKWIDSLRAKVKIFPQMKKNKNIFPKLKFSKRDVVIDKLTYPQDNFFLNFEKFLIDIVISFNKSNDKIMSIDTKNIGSFLLFFKFKKVCLSYLKTFQEMMSESFKNFQNQNISKLKNPLNETYLQTLNMLGIILKKRNDYSHLVKLNLKRTQFQGNNTLIDIMISSEVSENEKTIMLLPSLRLVDFDNGGINEIFNRNKSELSTQLKSSLIMSQIRSNIFLSQAQSKLQSIELQKTKDKSKKVEEALSLKLTENFHIFYENTIDVIIEFLD